MTSAENGGLFEKHYCHFIPSFNDGMSAKFHDHSVCGSRYFELSIFLAILKLFGKSESAQLGESPVVQHMLDNWVCQFCPTFQLSGTQLSGTDELFNIILYDLSFFGENYQLKQSIEVF